MHYMLSDNVYVYYVLNQRKFTLCNVFWTFNVYEVLSLNATVYVQLSYFARL